MSATHSQDSGRGSSLAALPSGPPDLFIFFSSALNLQPPPLPHCYSDNMPLPLPVVTTCFPPLTQHGTSSKTQAEYWLQEAASAVTSPSGRQTQSSFLPPSSSFPPSIEVPNIFSEIHKMHSSWQASCSAFWIQGLPQGEPSRSQAYLRFPGPGRV